MPGGVKTTTSTHHGRGVAEFLAKHGNDVTGVISGFDRLRLQGTLRQMYCPELMSEYLARAGVLYKDFKSHVTAVTARIRGAAETLARASGRPVHYLRNTAIRKEDLAAEIRRRDHIEEGLIAVFSAVEPCRTWFMRGDREHRTLELRLQWGKCIHLYFYLVHPQLGLMHLRLQTWFPFLVHVCLNGREWLARQLAQAGIAYTRADNCLPHVADVAAAQALLDQQVRTRWDRVLDPLIAQFHPTHRELHQIMPLDYYWTVAQSEYATDVMFRDRAALQRIYPTLVHHSMMSFGAEQVLRFLGRKQIGSAVDVKTDRRRGAEGVRVKHWLNRNSLKFYDKGSVLRDEVTINEPADFRVWRRPEGRPDAPKAWRELRRSVVDLPRRAEIGRAATDRHLGALAAAHHGESLQVSTATVCRPVVRKGRRHRALNPFAPGDAALLAAVNHGEFALNGLRNADLRAILYPAIPAGLTKRQLACRISRQLALLRAHGLIARVPRTRRYVVTKKGRTVITALLAAAQADIQQLTKLAA
jgi:hypothetical protein